MTTTPQPRRGRRPTMEDVARHVGVSRALVSLVFRDAPGAGPETRRRVLDAAEELGYRPHNAARMLARSRTRVLGVVMTPANPFHAELVEALYPQAEEAGYAVLLSALTRTRSPAEATEALLRNRCEALILLGPVAAPAEVAGLARELPVVTVGRRYPGSGADAVHTREARGIRLAVDHLVGLGHRAIAHIDGGNAAGSAERRRGYREAMRRHGLAGRVRVLSGDQTEASGAAAARTLLDGPERDRPTAVIAGNDRCAIGFLDAATRGGLDVPGDVSLVGFDDIPAVAMAHVALTTVHQDAGGLARAAVRTAAARAEDPDMEPRDELLEPELMVRGTTAAPRGG
ncbi:LacI family DNA-binding transcriptional regulator [Nocardiopsis sp. RSe5-2]|uniref:LacI family DNA-binding transcriptional regulator n=1 Tax=Nocardiopsis endophytica TaxID=3018445 RepID=A0ABT4U678_9ACTN|nr:LacI family DNA-binding transcriptional regulator [Nocardiopsis endophytica]MDA2812241.1 LacI family DNA-binding transcriptional regulator [Nocardiopsis endophytica]